MLHTLLYFTALFALSTAAIWAKLNQMPVEVLGFYRLGLAATLLGVFVLIRKPLRKPKFSPNALWIIGSGFFFFLHLWTYKYAAKNTSVSNMMIIFSSNPIWASMGAIAFFGEKLSKRLILAYLLGLAGVYLLVTHELSVGNGSHIGDSSAVLSAVFYAAYMLTGKKARNYFDNTYYALIQFTVCALCFGICVLATGAPVTGYSDISWVAVSGLVLFTTFLGHFSLTYLVKHMDLSMMTTGKLIEPIIASVLAYFIFREAISRNAWISFALTGSAVLILFGPGLIKSTRKILKT